MQSEIQVREKEILEKDSTIDMLQRHKNSNLTEFEKASGKCGLEVITAGPCKNLIEMLIFNFKVIFRPNLLILT